MRHFNLVILFLFLWSLQVALTWHSGAFTSELGGYPDEAAHYVTGLMVRDFITSGDLLHPMEFAENYYLHYPKVAFGHWQPLFYIVQAGWSLIFSSSKTSILLLIATLSTCIALTTSLIVKRNIDSSTGLVAGILVIILPLMQHNSEMVMAEMLMSLLILWAAIQFGNFLEYGRWGDMFKFSLFAGLAILTKGNGFALTFLPLSGLLITRRYDLLRNKRFWLMPVIVLFICVPYYILTFDMITNGMKNSVPTLTFTTKAIPFYSFGIIKSVGIVFFLLAAIGFSRRIISPYITNRIESTWAALGALPLSVLFFQFLAPCGFELRHLIPAVPVIIIFIIDGIHQASTWLPFNRIGKTTAISIVASTAFILSISTFSFPEKAWSGFEKIVDNLIINDEKKPVVVLVSSDSRGEGMLISEIAMKDKKRPTYFTLRSSKTLSTSRWDGSKYELNFQKEEEILYFLQDTPVHYIVNDKTIPSIAKKRHHELLSATLDKYPQHYKLVGKYPIVRGSIKFNKGLSVYRLISNNQKNEIKLRVDMEHMLKKNIEKTFKF